MKQLIQTTSSRFLSLLTIIILSSAVACEEIVDPDLIAADPIVSIDAWLTDETNSRVILSKTAPFNSNKPNPRISDALVKIENQLTGEKFIFEENPSGEGYYRPFAGSGFKAQARSRYRLIVEIDGINYMADIQVVPVPPIDSMTVETVEDGEDRDPGKYITFFYTDPTTSVNFYYWEVFKNGKRIGKEDIHISDDEKVSGSVFKIELPYTFQSNDVVEVKLHGFSQNAFNYYKALKLLVESGSPSQSIPENPISNIKDITSETPQEVVGYFNATSPSSFSMVID